jgi:hypothetical protein
VRRPRRGYEAVRLDPELGIVLLGYRWRRRNALRLVRRDQQRLADHLGYRFMVWDVADSGWWTVGDRHA